VEKHCLIIFNALVMQYTISGQSASITASSFLECLSLYLRVPGDVASPQIWGGQIFSL